MQLYKFQHEAVHWLRDKPRAVLGSDMGLGKTATAIVAAEKEFPEGNYLVVCPAFLVNGWREEIDRWSKRELPEFTWTVMSYEKFRRSGYAGTTPPEVFICDEGHYLKNYQAKRTVACLGPKSISRLAKRVWLLTGTPFPNNICDSYTLFNFCLRGVLGKYWDFAKEYAYVRDTNWGRKAYGLRRNKLPQLLALVKPIFYRDELELCLPDLPSFQQQGINLKYTDRVEAINGEMNRHQITVNKAIEDGKAPPPDPVLSRLRTELALEKVPEATEFCSNILEQGQSLVVFAYHRPVVEAMTKALAEHYTVACIHGDTKMADRTELVAKFQQGDIQCLVLSIKAAGEGITLTKAHVAAYVEVDWTPGSLLQTMRRIRRIGQKNFCLYYYFTFIGTLDESILDTLFNKVSSLDYVWDVWHGRETTPDDTEAIDWPEDIDLEAEL